MVPKPPLPRKTKVMGGARTHLGQMARAKAKAKAKVKAKARIRGKTVGQSPARPSRKFDSAQTHRAKPSASGIRSASAKRETTVHTRTLTRSS